MRIFGVIFLCLLPLSAWGQGIDRDAAYQKALPLYQYDARKPLVVKPGETRTIQGVKLLRFSYASTHGERVPALLFLPRTASAAHPALCLVLLHGLGGSKEVMAGLALEMARAGYASLAIDEYGQGERAGARPPDRSQAEELGLAVRQSAVDVRRGMDYLETRKEINPKRIGMVGVSLGAILSTVVSGVDSRVKAVALISGGGDWALILKTLAARNAVVGGRSTGSFRDVSADALNALLAPEDPLTFAAQIAPRALLMLGGRLDTTIVPKSSEELFEAARGPKEIRWYAAYGHVPPPELTTPAVKAFFAARL